MRTHHLLQVLYSFFLGLVVVGFVGVGLNTFYPQPRYDESNYGNPEGAGSAYQAAMDLWSLNASMILLTCATVLLAVSLVRPDRMAVLSNGLLLGGLFTMVYAVGMSLSGQGSVVRFGVIGAALAVTFGVGYLKFVRHKGTPEAGAATAGLPVEADESLDARVARVEAALDALRRALD